ncbi:MAG: 3-dehydroquinate synthase [Ignavibacteria bacterium CG_4_8_14_3_um_filter_37_9]|nr:3-dehydroquinate synthase [Ignavibacteria bacterium]OIO18643.1 MAG: 3-dehydroquinate synthase [Ignavibacteria bacterium CG1_02_37_35]PIP79525.1 MAG: 3-dehydroquinate synthase [Ignavibacteria bacterium CG22_combo_CG10-13_8_21_14_all_37_15]PIS45744.1 MAG: 3-dehydroquinate synthase [Ignavibacteria bacterium CG08_land_8_20_14_0_20_37_9]PIW99496.1 MAG: 3-dehydroquinate synthase [Ignavibacteria bacterium CG_4_8_14_3_um_filter_37_9]PIX94183.1 MAG: 3-dehydroquinate synthase [Ignavibacteria bacteriu
MKTLSVQLSENGYEILLGKDILHKFTSLCKKSSLPKRMFFIIDENVLRIHKKYLQTNLFDEKKDLVCKLPAGEKSKSFKQISELLKVMLENKLGRDTLVVSIGGGVTGDAVGFAASIFMRGIPVVHIPTTLLAAVDSSIGGKTGINFNNTKNSIGSFYQPKFVLIDTTFFSTLPEKEIICGVGEIIKYAFLTGQDFYDSVLAALPLFYQKDFSKTVHLISASINVKTEVVSSDEKETGLRKILNFGHTFAHSFESELHFKIKHGEAVTAGIICALYLSHEKGFITEEQLKKFLYLPKQIPLSATLKKLDKEKLYRVMLSDKKNRDGKIKFVLLKNIGEILLDVEAEKVEVFNAFDRMFKSI